MPSSANNVLLIDGHSLIHRAFFALPTLTTSGGDHTNAVYGFALMLGRLLEDENPSYVAVAFDLGKPTFRHEAYTAYKEDRPVMADELRSQIPLVKQLVKAYSISVFEVEGYEADDIIGTLARQAEEEDKNVLIVSSDMDMLQLVSERVTALITRRGIQDMERFGKEEVLEKVGVHPGQVVDFKGLAGDRSDGIPGVPQIGPKTAVRLLREYDTMENVLRQAEHIKGKIGQSLRIHRDKALLSKELARIRRDVPLDMTWEALRWDGPHYTELEQLYHRLEFRRLLDDLYAKVPELASKHHEEEDSRNSMPDTFEIMTDVTQFSALWDGAFNSEGTIALFPIYDGKLPYATRLIGLAVADTQRVGYIPVRHDHGVNMSVEEVKAIVDIIMSSQDAREMNRVTYDVKTMYHVLCPADPLLKTNSECVVDDVMLQGYVCDAGADSSLDGLSSNYIGKDFKSPRERQSRGKGPADERPEDLKAFIVSHCHLILKLYHMLRAKIEEHRLTDVYENLDLPLVPVLRAMEMRGIRIDQGQLHSLSREMEARLAQLEDTIYAMAGERFNLNSPKQMGDILFDRLGLPVLKKTKSGPSTSADVLEKLAEEHDIAGRIMDYRQIQKLKSTYVDPLPTLVNERTGRLHTTFHQAVAATGRLSSTGPNLQNIPIRTPEGRRIRKVFIPSEGYTFIQADYSQIELRVLAHISEDEELMDAFGSGVDIHQKTASEIFDVDPGDVSPSQRDAAKAVNFGIIYGISGFGLARGTGLSRQEAEEYIKRYFRRYSGVAQYTKEIVAQARSLGYVTTVSGRRRYIPDINSRRWHARNFAERTAINTPIQGSAADIIKEAMIALHRRMVEEKRDARLLLQVHDELLLEARLSDMEDIARIVKEEMEKAGSLRVPLIADVRWGSNWLEQQPVLF